MKGNSSLGLIIGVGSGITMLLVGWNSWLSTTVFSDHSDLSSLTASVGDIKDSVNNHVIPTLDSLTRYQGASVIIKYSTTTDQ